MIPRNLRCSPVFALVATLAGAAFLAIGHGCSSDKGQTKTTAMDSGSGESILDAVPPAPASDSPGGAGKGGGKPSNTDQVIAQLDQDFVIGPTAAGVLNYRVAWQYDSGPNTNLKGVALRDDSVYLLDDHNYLVRVRVSDGKAHWHTQVAEAVYDIIGVNVMNDRIYLTTGSEMLVLDAVNGGQLARWRFQKIAGTPPVEFGEYLIYGARSGELVWMARQVGYMWKAYHIATSIRVPPVIRGNAIAAVGTDGKRGTVMLLDASSATTFWQPKKLLEPVVCKPVMNDEALYVAGMDQYIWAYDLRSGRTLWHVMTEAPLTSSPSVIGDRLYQQIPGYGLSCYEALPIDTPGGKFHWKNANCTGSVIFERRGDLWAWDQQAKRLTTMERERGLTKRNLDLPHADYLMIGGDKGEDVFAASNDGRLVRLVPRN